MIKRKKNRISDEKKNPCNKLNEEKKESMGKNPSHICMTENESSHIGTIGKVFMIASQEDAGHNKAFT
jgi:hypothetical protein